MKYVETGSDYDHSVAYAYDTENKLTSLVETVNGVFRTTSYTYDSDNRITSIANGASNRIYEYDAYGRLESKDSVYSGTTLLTSTYNYRDVGSNTTSQVEQLVLSGSLNRTYAYEYDDNGNIVRITDHTGATEYTYDSANQLIREDNQGQGYTHTWTYDNAGNIQTRKEYPYTPSSLTNVTPTDTVTYSYGNSNWGDLLTAYDGQTITYDAIGNPLSDGTWTYTWEHGRQLASMTGSAGTWSYTYNADGLRTERKGNTYTYSYTYNGGQLTHMTRKKNSTGATDTIWFGYDAEGPTFIKYNSTTYQYVTNLQGDVIALLDSSGNVVVEYTYDAWGKLLSTTGSLASTLGQRNPLRYRGYVYDHETGLYYLQSRYYDPEIGRFINADCMASTGQGFIGYNMFAYCLNCPCNYVDCGGFRAAFLNGLEQVSIEMVEKASSHPKDSPPDHPNFTPPKKGNKKVRNPNGKGWGWLDDKGNVWIWEPKMHGDPGWVVQEPGGGHSHAYPGGGIRTHFEAAPNNSVSITIFPENITTGMIVFAGGTIMVCFLAVEGYLLSERSVK